MNSRVVPTVSGNIERIRCLSQRIGVRLRSGRPDDLMSFRDVPVPVVCRRNAVYKPPPLPVSLVANPRLYPPWYTGFVDASDISVGACSTDLSDPEIGLLRFQFFDPTGKLTLSFCRFILIGAEKPIENTIRIATKMSYESACNLYANPNMNLHGEFESLRQMKLDLAEYFDSSFFDYDEEKRRRVLDTERTSLTIVPYWFEPNFWERWTSYPTRDDFQDISLTNLGDRPIEITGLRIRLNTKAIFSSFATPGDSIRTLGIDETWGLRDQIYRFKMKNLITDHFNHPQKIPRVLEIAAREVGKCYDIKYIGGWHCPGTERQHWVYRPNSFCTEFSSWAIRQVTDLEPPQLGRNDVEGNLGLQRLVDDFFAPAGRWIGAHSQENRGKAEVTGLAQSDLSRYYWNNLGNLIAPGDFCCEHVPPPGSGGHAMFFVGWCDQYGVPRDFDPSLSRNYFHTVSGNWSMLNQTAIFTVGWDREPISGFGHIRWGWEYNGFGLLHNWTET